MIPVRFLLISNNLLPFFLGPRFYLVLSSWRPSGSMYKSKSSETYFLHSSHPSVRIHGTLFFTFTDWSTSHFDPSIPIPGCNKGQLWSSFAIDSYWSRDHYLLYSVTQCLEPWKDPDDQKKSGRKDEDTQDHALEGMTKQLGKYNLEERLLRRETQRKIIDLAYVASEGQRGPRSVSFTYKRGRTL